MTWLVGYGLRFTPQRHPEVFTAWDARQYISVARDGYPSILVTTPDGPSPLAFFPGYPAVVRVVERITGWAFSTSAVVVSLAAGLAATVLFWLLARRLLGDGNGPRVLAATALFAFFPGAYVFSMGYADGLFLALAIGCALALVSERWLVAGVLAALATGTMPAGFALVVAVVVAAAVAVRRDRSPKPLAAVVLAPLGGLAFLALLEARTGSFLAWKRAGGNGWAEGFPADWLRNAVEAVLDGPQGAALGWLALIAIVVFALGVFGLVRMGAPPSLTAYTAAIAVGVFLTGAAISSVRYTLIAFPIVLAAARWIPPVYVAPAVATSGGLMMAMLFMTVVSNSVVP